MFFVKDCGAKFGLSVFIAFIALAPFFPAAVHSLSIRPVQFFVTVDPGDSAAVVLRIKNDEEKEGIFKLAVVSMRQDELGRSVFSNEPDEAEGWVRPARESVMVEAGKEMAVEFLINVPTGAAPAPHFLGLTVQPAGGEGGAVGLTGRLAAILLLQVAGQVNEAASLVSWRALDRLTSKRIWPFELYLENNGNVDLPLAGKIEIRNWLGAKIFEQDIVMGNNLLARSVRHSRPVLSLPREINLSEARVKELHWRPGLYQAQIRVEYGRSKQIITAIEEVWYFPWWSWALLAGVVLLGGTVAIIKKRGQSAKYHKP